MPSTSAKQAKFMRVIAHSPSFAKKVGVKQSVGKDFEMADRKMKKFDGGGSTPKKPVRGFNDPDGGRMPTQSEANKLMKPAPKPVKQDPDTLGMKKAKGGKCYAKGGSAFRSSANGIAKKGKTRAMMPKMAKGGKAMKGCK